MAEPSISDMYDQIMEVVDKIWYSDKAREFLEEIEERAHDENLVGGQVDFLRSLWKQACESPY